MIKLRILNYVNEEIYNSFMNKVAKSATEILKVEDNVYLNVVICDNEMIKDYNNRYRQIDRERK